jgi:hypothetical protein
MKQRANVSSPIIHARLAGESLQNIPSFLARLSSRAAWAPSDGKLSASPGTLAVDGTEGNRDRAKPTLESTFFEPVKIRALSLGDHHRTPSEKTHVKLDG